MAESRNQIRRGGDRRGWALGLHVVLVLVVGVELLMLSATFRWRVDGTEDARYSLTGATERVLSRLEQPLVIEAYFSPDEELGVRWADRRRVLREVLDEFVQRGDGRVRVDVFDPRSDVEVRAKAERLGIRPNPIQDFEGGTLSTREVWQGLRFTYGGRLQRVVGFAPFTDHTAAYESLFTPLVAALIQGDRPRIGIAYWSTGRPGAPAFDRMLQLQAFTDRFEFVSLDLSVKDRIDADLDLAILIGPRALTKVQKYALDQFLLRGGTLVCFVDGVDVETQEWSLRSEPMPWDDQESLEGRFVDQLRCYGIEVDGPGRILLDAGSSEVPFAVRVSSDRGSGNVRSQLQPLAYPYWFAPSDTDWRTRAAAFASQLGGDESLAADLARALEPGIAEDLRRVLIAPELFWPVAVDPTAETPAGLEVRTLMRTSPLQDVQPSPDTVAPFRGPGLEAGYRRWIEDVLRATRRDLAYGVQRGLFVESKGQFSSFFRGIPPPRPEDVDASAADLGPAATTDDRSRLTEGIEDGRLLVFGDATFLRDDFAFGELANFGAPRRTLGHSFFLSLLDWLAGDPDLIELRERRPVDRRQVFLEVAERSDLDLAAAGALERDRVRFLRRVNLIVPPLLLVAFGVVVVLRRRRGARRAIARARSRQERQPA